VVDVCVVVVNDHIVPAVPCDRLFAAAQVCRFVGVHLETIALGPRVDVGDNVRRVGISARVDASSIWNRAVLEAVELHNRDRVAAGVARRQFLVGIQVDGARYRSKGCNPLCGFGVACQEARETSSVRLACGKDAGFVDAVVLLYLIQKFKSELDIINRWWGVWIALELLCSLRVLQHVSIWCFLVPVELTGTPSGYTTIPSNPYVEFENFESFSWNLASLPRP
jgi:hypothetical protein